MSEEGKNILNLFKQVRAFCVQVSNLLLTVDEQMGAEGLESYNNTAIAYSSASIMNPKQWVPDSFFRFYNLKEHKNVLVFVSILADDDVSQQYKLKLNEPLITAGFFDYGKGKEVGDNFDYWYSSWLGYIANYIEDGKIYESKSSWKEDEKEDYPFESWKCFGLPLISINKAQDVSSKITKPLVNLLPSRKC
jgi:hypothetical protein